MCDNMTPLYWTGGSDGAGFIDLIPNTPVPSMAKTGTANITSLGVVTDSLGGTDAATITLGSTDTAYFGFTSANVIPGMPLWIEFDLRAGVSGNLNTILVIYANGGAVNGMQRYVDVPTGTIWQKIRIPYTPRANTANQLVFKTGIAGSGGSFDLGRVRLYHAWEPIKNGHRPFSVSNYSSTWTGTPDRTTSFNTSTVTLAQLAARVEAIEQDLIKNGY